MKQLSSIGSVNFRKQKGPNDTFMGPPTDYINFDQHLSAGQISLQPQSAKKFALNLEQAGSKEAAAAKDSYLKMMKNKEMFSRKIVMGGGFEV